jgi:hypothetical protein
MKFTKYSSPQLIDLSLKSINGACSPSGSQDDGGDCSEGNEATGGGIFSKNCSFGTSPEGLICAGGGGAFWNRCRSGSGVL